MEKYQRSHAVQTLWHRYHGLMMAGGKRAMWFENVAYLAGESPPEEFPLTFTGIMVAE